MSPAISNAFGHMDANGSLTIDSNDKMILEDSLRVGFTTEDMADG